VRRVEREALWPHHASHCALRAEESGSCGFGLAASAFSVSDVTQEGDTKGNAMNGRETVYKLTLKRFSRGRGLMTVTMFKPLFKEHHPQKSNL